MVKITPELIAVVQHLRFNREFEHFTDHLRAKLEDAKAALVDAPPQAVPTLQGHAQVLRGLLALVDAAPQEAHGTPF